jgi:hypothetical protein
MPDRARRPQTVASMVSGPERAPKDAHGEARAYVASHGPVEGSPGGRPCAKRWRACSRACSHVRDEKGALE